MSFNHLELLNEKVQALINRCDHYHQSNQELEKIVTDLELAIMEHEDVIQQLKDENHSLRDTYATIIEELTAEINTYKTRVESILGTLEGVDVSATS
ncbi:hypothetical protein [Desulfurispira natronophila]|uniref:FtsZ-binding cell division protein ZapB n=1 Tax=Desulfurispira natronophila TaxID=682562 RepID=A0A7W7Y4P8_9BACT|nr:hypothetical protein [Desulfurispira natronophila]MBB5022040.1 FtsZ-binding cell division protein ZapB [Desulfurispira natronophila]